MDIVFLEQQESETERLQRISHTVTRAVEILAIVTSIVVFLASYCVIVIVIKRKRFRSLPIKVQIALIFFAILTPGAIFYNSC